MNKPSKLVSIAGLAVLAFVATLALSGAIVLTLDGSGSAEEAILDAVSDARQRTGQALRLTRRHDSAPQGWSRVRDYSARAESD